MPSLNKVYSNLHSDYATGKIINLKDPEEKVRQNIERILHLELHYPIENLDIEVKIPMGTTFAKADIVVFAKDKKAFDIQKNALFIIETKSPNKKYDKGQLGSYLLNSSASLGLWTNGTKFVFLTKDMNKIIEHPCRQQIPYFNELVKNSEDIVDFIPAKKDLKPCENIKELFKKILGYLYANAKKIGKREKLAKELIKILFCKLVDEKYYPEQKPEFFINTKDRKNIALILDHCQKLFQKVKERMDDIFDKTEQLELDAQSVFYVVDTLKNYSLLKTSKDYIGEAFETFVESLDKGEKGQFFTPREIVKIAIEILNPKPNETLIDPACGSGAFLIEALTRIWGKLTSFPEFKGMGTSQLNEEKTSLAQKNFFGIDRDPELTQICKAYLCAIGDGRSNIFHENSLDNWSKWSYETQKKLVINNSLKQFDYVITNPPFGVKNKITKDIGAPKMHKYRAI